MNPPLTGGFARSADLVRSECDTLGITGVIDLAAVRLGATTETTLYRVVGEGMSDVARHLSAITLVQVRSRGGAALPVSTLVAEPAS